MENNIVFIIKNESYILENARNLNEALIYKTNTVYDNKCLKEWTKVKVTRSKAVFMNIIIKQSNMTPVFCFQ